MPKAYIVAVSPVRPNLAAVGTNTGMAFMTFDRMYPLPVAAMPLRNLAEAHVSPALRLPYEPIAASYVAHTGDSVWFVSCTAVARVRSSCQSFRGCCAASFIAWTGGYCRSFNMNLLWCDCWPEKNMSMLYLFVNERRLIKNSRFHCLQAGLQAGQGCKISLSAGYRRCQAACTSSCVSGAAG